MKTKKTKLVIFDLDGTLVDTAADLAYSMNLVMRELNLPKQGVQKVRRHIGNGARRLVEGIVSTELGNKPDKDTLERALTAFNKHYQNNLVRESCLYPHIHECLERLRSSGIKLACVTNKPKTFTLPVLRHFQIERYFDLVISGDSLQKKKPDAFPLKYVCNRLGVESSECIMVGDSRNDMLAARNAGIHSVCVSYGYTEVEDINMLKPDTILNSCAKLLELV